MFAEFMIAGRRLAPDGERLCGLRLWGARVVRGDYAAVGGGAAEAVEHSIRFPGDAGDSVGGLSFATDVSGHGAENVGARAVKDEAAIVADAFEFAGLVGDF